jgi:hypothetical protein
MQQVCKGINASDGQSCKRTTKLSATGYCYQHSRQDPLYNEPVAATQMPPTQKLMVTAQHAVEKGGHSSKNDNSERSNTGESLSSVLSAGSSSSAVSALSGSVPTSKGDMPRCTAIAKSTGLQCCKRVSFADETRCPRHSGRQIKLASALPFCTAISKSTRQQCLNHVSFAGQTLCAIHGGSTLRMAAISPVQRNVLAMAAPMAPVPKQQKLQQESKEYEEPRGWANIQVRCMTYLMDTHPKSKCQCSASAEPCQGMKIVLWAQALVQLAQQQEASQSTIFKAKVSDLVQFIPTTNVGDNKNLFSDLYAAVRMFGSNIFFLPRFYQHIQHVANVEPTFVPPLLRPSTTAVRMQLDDDRESSAGSMDVDEEEGEGADADNGKGKEDIF